eukprot:3332717-Heterocapsa_arctica.AAC.2
MLEPEWRDERWMQFMLVSHDDVEKIKQTGGETLTHDVDMTASRHEAHDNSWTQPPLGIPSNNPPPIALE